MKTSLFLLITFIALSISVSAQNHIGKTRFVTFYDKYKPAKILLQNGRVLKERQVNVFLKDGSLLYMSRNKAMQANMKQIKSVTFDDCHFLNVNNSLAYVVDSIIIDSLRNSKLLCNRIIDAEAYKNQVINSQHLTKLEMGIHVGMTTTDATDEDIHEFPVINNYYYLIDGKIVRVHERDIKRFVSKEKFNLVRSIMQLPDFSWGDEKFLIQILGLISLDKYGK